MTSFSVVPWCYKLSNKNESTVKLFNISMVKRILCGTICMRCLLFTLTENVWNDVKTTLLLQNWVEETTFWNIFLSYELLDFNRKQKYKTRHFRHDFLQMSLAFPSLSTFKKKTHSWWKRKIKIKKSKVK